MAVRDFRGVLDEVLRRPGVHGTRIVGVDGPAASGKSTLARRLVALSGATLVQVDDFVSWHDVSGWWPRFEHEVLDPLLAGRAAVYQARDWAGDEFGAGLGEWKTVPWAPLVVVEGVTCTRRAAEGRLAQAIWVEAPRELRLARGVARDGESHRDLWLRWMREEEDFFAADGTRERADLRVDAAPRVAHAPATQFVTL